MEMAAITHKGNVRENNEDAYYLDTERGQIFAVADGMGGHKAGEVASAIAIDQLKNMFCKNEPVTDAVAAIQAVFQSASDKIAVEARENPDCDDMGTTFTLAYRLGSVLFVGHIGDSRAYLLGSEGIQLITRDHTLVAELVRSGGITKSEARNHPQRNVIMKALGSGCQPIPDIHEIEIEEACTLLICSDGMSDLVEDHEIEATLKDAPTLVDAVKSLKEKALSRGGHDNITIVCARIKSA